MPTAIPTSSTMDEVMPPIGSQRLGMASSEIALITAVPASSNGMPAATSAPNTISSRASDTGTEVTSAFLKSWLVSELVARSTLAASRFGDGQARVLGPHRGDSVQRGHHGLVVVVRVAGDVERDERRSPAGQSVAGKR